MAAALNVLPDAPGVYLFSDASGTVIYVGKAARLTQRVRSYWQAGAIPGAHRIRDAIDQVASYVRHVNPEFLEEISESCEVEEA